MATGPDGAIWFTSDPDSIGRITISGVASYFTSSEIGDPTSITAGPDGALWFTSESGNYIGRITTSGAVTTYTDPTIDQPTQITVGPDGALWFLNIGNDSIGRMTTSGVVSNFTSPNLNLSPDYVAAMTLGPDGNLWFSNGGNSIGEVVFPQTAPSISGTPPTPIGQSGFYYYPFDLTGVPSPTVSLESGSLPPGLNLSTSGVVSGDPSAVGEYTATVLADNGVSPNSTDTFTIDAEPVPPSLSGTPGRMHAGNPYLYQFSLSGLPPPTVSVTAGELPPGLTLTTEGQLSGTPTLAGRYNVTLTATNGYTPDAIETIKLVVKPSMTISPTKGPPHKLVDVAGAGYQPGETVLVTWGGTRPPQICSATVQNDGTFACSGEIPGRKKAGSDGFHWVYAVGQSSGDVGFNLFNLRS